MNNRNIYSIYKFFGRHKIIVLFSIFTCLLFTYCKLEPQLWKLTPDKQGIGDYVEYYPEQFSEFSKLADLTKLKALLNVRGPYTVFLPTNEAMFTYYREKNVNSLEDFPEASLQKLIRNHIVCTIQNYYAIGLGALRDTNALGDYLETEFKDADTYLNKTAKIIKKNIKVNNGMIHIIDSVLDPVTKDIYTLLSEDPAYRIFSEGLRLTGIKDTLEIVSFPYMKQNVRNRFTLLAVPDTIYQRFGIHSVQELIAWCGASPDSLTSKSNSFYRYIDYHCLIGTHYLNYLRGLTNYPTFSGENFISMTTTDDYKLNLDTVTGIYTGFIVPACNIPAKNGVIHTVNGLLPVFHPKPREFYFETTDYPDLKHGDYYGKYYMKWSDGQNSFAKIKFQGEYLQYYFNYYSVRGSLWNGDCLSMAGMWWIELTTPKIVKGRYRIRSGIFSGSPDFPRFEVYIDGVKVNEIDARLSSQMIFGEVNWTKSGEHKIKLVCTVEGRLFWDLIIFTPLF